MSREQLQIGKCEMQIANCKALNCARLVLVCEVFAALNAIGCGGPKIVPVSGTVTIDGQPLTTGHIFVMPKDGRAASGKIDKQGRFTLSTNDPGDGCLLGTHVVTVIARDDISPTRVKFLIPTKYADPQSSETTVTIKGPTDDLQIALTWAGGKPYIQTFDGQGDVGPGVGSTADSGAKP